MNYKEDLLNIVKEKGIVNIIETYKKHFEWLTIINKYNNDWKCISEKQNLSEDFIREFQDKVDWKYISKYQKLSEDFIREFQDKM